MEAREELKKLRESTGMNRKEFCEYFEIPYMTETDWELGNRRVPTYLLRLMEYKIRIEQLADKRIKRAMESCKSAEIEVSDHFADAVKMVEIGSKAVRDVDDAGFGRIRSKGDQALFGGRSTQEMKEKLGVSDKRPLADFLPTLTIAAKNLATEMTNYNVEEKDLKGEGAITTEHVQNNTTVREMLGTRGIKPEELPPSEDIKKLERKVKLQEKKIAKESGVLPKKIEE